MICFSCRSNVIIFALCIIFTQIKGVTLPEIYGMVVEKLILYKENSLKIFYGGPIDNSGAGVTWIMPATFENSKHKTRAAYEISFVHCTPETAHDASIICISASDIDIKFKNNRTNAYALFTSLIDGSYSEKKYVVVRSCDVAHTYFPDIFIKSLYGKELKSDKTKLVHFLHTRFSTQDVYNDLSVTQQDKPVIARETNTEIIYKPQSILVDIESKTYDFSIEQRVIKSDTWKLYYLISKKNLDKNNTAFVNDALIRIDSGCVSGQIYNDASCDCLDQLHHALKELILYPDSFVVHIPAHDGRGFGTSPKAETEIYKMGGVGRIHTAQSKLDTISAAKLLYNTDQYDIRSFEGVGLLLRDMGITQIQLLTDNVAKVEALTSLGILVTRIKTNTNKETCLSHIQAKFKSPLYFTE